MIGISFEKARAQQFITALAEGGPIPHKGPWTADEMLALAGACFFGVASQGPTVDKVARLMGKDVPERHPEHAEASDEQFMADIHGAIEFIANLTTQVNDRAYDEHFEPTVRALLDGAAQTIQPIE